MAKRQGRVLEFPGKTAEITIDQTVEEYLSENSPRTPRRPSKWKYRRRYIKMVLPRWPCLWSPRRHPTHILTSFPSSCIICSHLQIGRSGPLGIHRSCGGFPTPQFKGKRATTKRITTFGRDS